MATANATSNAQAGDLGVLLDNRPRSCYDGINLLSGLGPRWVLSPQRGLFLDISHYYVYNGCMGYSALQRHGVYHTIQPVPAPCRTGGAFIEH